MKLGRTEIRRATRRLRRNWVLKLISLVFAVWLWAFVNLGERDAEKTLVLALELGNLPQPFLVTNPVVDSVDVRIKGPRTLLGTVQERDQAIRLDLSSVRTGRTSFRIEAEMLSLPRGVRAVRVSPSQILLDIERMIEKELPVTIDFAESIPTGYRVVKSEIEPAAVRVRGPANEVDSWKAVSTQPVYLPPAEGEVERIVRLDNPGDLTSLAPERVSLRLELEEVIASQQLRGVELEVRNASGPVKIRQRKIDVTVTGPERLLRDLKAATIKAFVDAEGLATGKHTAKVQVALPDGVSAVETRPQEILLQVLKASEPSKSS